jgi:aryl-alcohol dehydrogenase-like predicted oxidoreductase
VQYRSLGRTGIKVSPYALGAMMFGAIGNPDHDDAIRIIHKALDAGINFIDTADMYSHGESEEIVGKPSRAVATTSSSPPRSTPRWATTRTSKAFPAGGSSPKSRTR